MARGKEKTGGRTPTAGGVDRIAGVPVPVPVERLNGVLDKRGVVDTRSDDTLDPGQVVPEVGRHRGIHCGRVVGGQRGLAGNAAVGTLDDDGTPIRSGDDGRAKYPGLAVHVRL
jgi:hypothetical protein